MKFYAAIAMAAIAIVTTPLSAQGNPSKPAESPKDKVVCKSALQTGTRFPKKTCHTVAQWDIIAEENRRTFQEANGPTINTARGN